MSIVLRSEINMSQRNSKKVYIYTCNQLTLLFVFLKNCKYQSYNLACIQTESQSTLGAELCGKNFASYFYLVTAMHCCLVYITVVLFCSCYNGEMLRILLNLLFCMCKLRIISLPYMQSGPGIMHSL